MLRLVQILIREESGQGMVEYALALIFVAMAVIASLTVMGEHLRDFYYQLSDIFPAG